MATPAFALAVSAHGRRSFHDDFLGQRGQQAEENLLQYKAAESQSGLAPHNGNVIPGQCQSRQQTGQPIIAARKRKRSSFQRGRLRETASV